MEAKASFDIDLEDRYLDMLEDLRTFLREAPAKKGIELKEKDDALIIAAAFRAVWQHELYHQRVKEEIAGSHDKTRPGKGMRLSDTDLSHYQQLQQQFNVYLSLLCSVAIQVVSENHQFNEALVAEAIVLVRSKRPETRRQRVTVTPGKEEEQILGQTVSAAARQSQPPGTQRQVQDLRKTGGSEHIDNSEQVKRSKRNGP